MLSLSRLLARKLALCCALALLLVLPPLHAADDNPPGRLASAAWLKQNLARADLLVLDASPGPMHRQAHIPGAVQAGLFGFGLQSVPVAETERRLRTWGVSPGRRIVIVDPGGSYFAPRLFWDLVHAGLPATSLHILDGGMAAWLAAGGAVTKDATPPPPPGTVSLAAADERVRVRLPEFLAATADPQRHVMLEALDPPYFYGGAGFFNRYGHMPHATLMPADDFFNADKTFKQPAEIQRLLDHLGVRRDQQVLTYCGGGGAAAVPYFVLRHLLDYPDVRMFQESQFGWLQDPRELPVWTYGAPALVRDAPWLKAWASPMLKAFGLSRVSVLDIRSAEQFKLGHVPTAVNLPAAAFADAALRPEALATLLGQAGVDRNHEAVLVSEGGLTPDAALAFVALERLGQRQVSIQLDSVERWAELGYDVVRPAAASAAPAAAAPKTVPYTAGAGQDRVLRSAGTAAGAMPRVYIASGAKPPARAPEGRVLHLPYADFLDANGRPKAAKDIWAMLAKAGVPRYAELVTLADAPGEAAVNYVILRLMGLADVKLLLP
jgi:thiosulfate/3-mercaptopyruvate sulfurtransferase